MDAGNLAGKARGGLDLLVFFLIGCIDCRAKVCCCMFVLHFMEIILKNSVCC